MEIRLYDLILKPFPTMQYRIHCLRYNPPLVSVADGSVVITARIINIGKAINQPLAGT